MTGTQYTDSDALCTDIAEQSGNVCVLSFSAGKDSVGSWLHLRRHFEHVVPVYLYLVPGLSFVEEGLTHYEQWFGQRVIRMPHPSLYRMLNNLTFQAPEHCQVIEQLRLPNFDYDDAFRVAMEDIGLPPKTTWTAVGVRAVDSLNRWAAIKQYGPLVARRRVFYPIYDWRKARLVEEITREGCGLPMDYDLFGRSFDGIDWRFLLPLRDRYPDDYRRILDFFPLAEAEVFRMDVRKARAHA